MEITGKIALVTGASSGIGYATAKLLAEQGATVALVARSADKLRRLEERLPHAAAYPADMTREAEIRAVVSAVSARFGRIDILVNNAGRGYGSPLELIDPIKYRSLFELDVIGPLVAMQATIPVMRSQGGGVIVNISSGTTLSYIPGVSAYASLKRALNTLSITARSELERDHIRVGVVYPYITDTDFYRNMERESGAGFDPSSRRRNPNLPPPDTAGFVGELIIRAIVTEDAETYAHEWMGR